MKIVAKREETDEERSLAEIIDEFADDEAADEAERVQLEHD